MALRSAHELDISDLDKVELLRQLWLNMPPASFFAMSGRTPPPFNEKLAKSAVLKYIDYFEGRCIKTDLSYNVVDTRSYNRDAGEGKFEAIVAEMRQRQQN
jgi:hypothetical protein